MFRSTLISSSTRSAIHSLSAADILLVVELVELLETAAQLDGFVLLLVLEAVFGLLLIGLDSVFIAA